MALDSTPGDLELAPEPDGEPPVTRPLGRRIRLAMILAAVGVFLLLGPVGAAEQLGYAIQYVLPGASGGCGGG